jgi:hypothetical protein
MKLYHKLKSKRNEIPLGLPKFGTEHKMKAGEVSHEGWFLEAEQEDKGHVYTLMFSPDEARKFHAALTQMLDRFDDDTLSFILVEEHDE